MKKKDKQIVIHDEVKVTMKFITKVIEGYKQLPENFSLSMGYFSGNRDKIIDEIRKLSKVGKEILMIHYKYDKKFPKVKK